MDHIIMGQIKSKQKDSLEAKHCVPLGLYSTCNWPPKTLKKLICDKKLAPIFKGIDDDTPGSLLDECPICFMLYPSLNHARCCKQDICTECFLQLKPFNSSEATCPFCNRTDFHVYFTGPKSKAERKAEEEDQKKVEEAQKRMREEEIKRDKEREDEKARKLAEEKEKKKELEESKKESIPEQEEVPEGYESESSEVDYPVPNVNMFPHEQEGFINYPPPPLDNPHPAQPPQQPIDFQAMIASNEDPDRVEELMMMEAIRLSLIENGGN